MIGGVGYVRGLTVMIATEGIFVWCAVTPTSGVNTVDAPLQERGKSRKKLNRDFSVIGNPLKVDFLLSRATSLCINNN
jgi:hypothetical protein